MEGDRRRVTAVLALEVFLLTMASLSLLALLLASTLSSDFERNYANATGQYSDMHSAPPEYFDGKSDNASIPTGQYSDMFSTQVTPASFTFSIWTLIYIWQCVWLSYAWSFIFRRCSSCCGTRTINIAVYPGYTLACSLLIAWLYLFGNYLINVCLAVLIIFNIVIYITIGILSYFFFSTMSTTACNCKYDIILTRLFVFNGLSVLASWTTIAMLLNFAIVLQHSSGVSASTTGTITLTLLAVVVGLYFSLENTILDKYVRYVFVVYPVVIWGLIGIVAEHWGKSGETRNSVYALVLLLATTVLLVIRVALFFVFLRFRPLKKRPAATNAANPVVI